MIFWKKTVKMAERRFRKERVFEFLKDDKWPSQDKMKIIKPLSLIFGCVMFSLSMTLVFFMDYCMDKEVTAKSMRSLTLEKEGLESHARFFDLNTEDHAFGFSVTRKEDYRQMFLFCLFIFLLSLVMMIYVLCIETGREIAVFRPGERISNAVYTLNCSAVTMTVLNTTYSECGHFLVSYVSNGKFLSKVHQTVSELQGKNTEALFPGYVTEVAKSKKGNLVLIRLAKRKKDGD